MANGETKKVYPLAECSDYQKYFFFFFFFFFNIYFEDYVNEKNLCPQLFYGAKYTNRVATFWKTGKSQRNLMKFDKSKGIKKLGYINTASSKNDALNSFLERSTSRENV